MIKKGLTGRNVFLRGRAVETQQWMRSRPFRSYVLVCWKQMRWVGCSILWFVAEEGEGYRRDLAGGEREGRLRAIWDVCSFLGTLHFVFFYGVVIQKYAILLVIYPPGTVVY